MNEEDFDMILSGDEEFQDWLDQKKTYSEEIHEIDLEDFSSCFVSASYQKAFECMRLVFKTNQESFYDYHVSQEIWDGFVNAESKGKYYHKFIKPKALKNSTL